MTDVLKIFPTRIFLSICGIVYVLFLPYLVTIGFSQKVSTSIFAIITNPKIIGTMATISFIPFTIIWEYRNMIATKSDNIKIYTIFYYTFWAALVSLATYQIGFILGQYSCSVHIR